MPASKDLSLEKYQISKYAYRELHNFCLQYTEKKRRLAGYDGIKTPSSALCEQLRSDLCLIEQSAMEADGGIYRQLIKNVTEGTSYWNLDVPCSKQYFYLRRQNFFRLLAAKKRMI